MIAFIAPLIPAIIIGWGIYTICFEENVFNSTRLSNDHVINIIDDDLNSVSSDDSSNSQELNSSENVTSEVDTDSDTEEFDRSEEEIEDLWSSYQLEKKYNEMKDKKPLSSYLNLKEWKIAVRRRFREFINSHSFKKSPENFLKEERSKRGQDEYAVIDDTALNLVEYFNLISSQDGVELDNLASTNSN